MIVGHWNTIGKIGYNPSSFKWLWYLCTNLLTFNITVFKIVKKNFFTVLWTKIAAILSRCCRYFATLRVASGSQKEGLAHIKLTQPFCHLEKSEELIYDCVVFSFSTDCVGNSNFLCLLEYVVSLVNDTQAESTCSNQTRLYFKQYERCVTQHRKERHAFMTVVLYIVLKKYIMWCRNMQCGSDHADYLRLRAIAARCYVLLLFLLKLTCQAVCFN